VQSAEFYRTQADFYGRFEARIRFAPGEGVVSSFFLWKDIRCREILVETRPPVRGRVDLSQRLAGLPGGF